MLENLPSPLFLFLLICLPFFLPFFISKSLNGPNLVWKISCAIFCDDPLLLFKHISAKRLVCMFKKKNTALCSNKLTFVGLYNVRTFKHIALLLVKESQKVIWQSGNRVKYWWQGHVCSDSPWSNFVLFVIYLTTMACHRRAIQLNKNSSNVFSLKFMEVKMVWATYQQICY